MLKVIVTILFAIFHSFVVPKVCCMFPVNAFQSIQENGKSVIEAVSSRNVGVSASHVHIEDSNSLRFGEREANRISYKVSKLNLKVILVLTSLPEVLGKEYLFKVLERANIRLPRLPLLVQDHTSLLI